MSGIASRVASGGGRRHDWKRQESRQIWKASVEQKAKDGTPLRNSYQMEYCPVKYERPTYFQLSIAYADINYCFANFKYVERYVNISY
jgi:hypothetical protein